jgi:glucose-6-phosphate 1-epimerase
MNQTLLANEYGEIKLIETSPGMQVLEFIHRTCRGKISLYGGQVLDWQPKNQQPVFWLSSNAAFTEGKAIRGGIPLCWPWFGGEAKLASGESIATSNHGFARQSQWTFDQLEISATGVSIELKLAGENLSPYFPAAFSLQQSLHFGDAFEQALTMTNLSEHKVQYTGALHSYFQVGDPQLTEVTGLNDVLYDDKLSGEKLKKSTLVHCFGPIDRVYYDANTQVIVDKKWQRKLAVSSVNCQQWVFWNPGVDAIKMVDIHHGGEKEFVCLEAANTQWQTISAGKSSSIGQRVCII